jgi:hypothetical protein
MPFDSNGNYTKPAGSTAVTGATILASTHNTPIDDITSALNLTFCRDGRAPATDDFAMGGNKITGLGDATTDSDAPNLGQIGATFVRVDAAQTFTDDELDQAAENLGGAARIKQYAAQATTSGTSFNFNDIPAWAKIIKFVFSGVSLNATEDVLIQLGTASSFEVSGYVASRIMVGTPDPVSSANSTAGFLAAGGAAGNLYSGIAEVVNLTGNTWCQSGVMSLSSYVTSSGGTKTLSDTLTRVRVLRSGSSSFDAGSISVICIG